MPGMFRSVSLSLSSCCLFLPSFAFPSCVGVGVCVCVGACACMAAVAEAFPRDQNSRCEREGEGDGKEWIFTC